MTDIAATLTLFMVQNSGMIEQIKGMNDDIKALLDKLGGTPSVLSVKLSDEDKALLATRHGECAIAGCLILPRRPMRRGTYREAQHERSSCAI